jgi:hypothetical protein
MKCGYQRREKPTCHAGRIADPRRPDGKKKAYVRLTADFDALEVANKVSRGSNRGSCAVWCGVVWCGVAWRGVV